MGRVARHGREKFFIEGEGVIDTSGTSPRKEPAARAAALAAADEEPAFRFSRLGPTGIRTDRALRVKLARAMTGPSNVAGAVPAGYTYLGQFVDHDLTFDRTTVALGTAVTPADLLQGRSPTLDLDSLYGNGPTDPVSAPFYSDGLHLKVGRTVRSGSDLAKDGMDLPRVGGTTGTDAEKRKALIPDPRNDENLAVAQHHAAFIRFHNRVVDTLPPTPDAQKFDRARRRVVLHYQWMLRHDYLPRICDPTVVADVFRNGRKVIDVGADPFSMPTMPIEFSVAAFRLGHAMVREAYDWNARFNNGGGTLDLLFFFSGVSGDLGGNLRLPSNWIADWRRIYRFSQIGHTDLNPPEGEFNLARRIDTSLVDPLSVLPPGSFGGTDSQAGTIEANLAFRNLTRAAMLNLASGQQMAAFLRSKGVPVTTLTGAQIRNGQGGAVVDNLADAQRQSLLAATPLWFYILREAELNGGKLAGVGARIVAETFHRAMEASTSSIVRSPNWRPVLGEVDGRFRMADLLFFAFQERGDLLAPLGD